LPSTSIDTFFACTIILAAALISTAFLTSTMQTTMNSTQDINKESYLKGIADHLVTNPGTPTNWATSSRIPADFGLASSSSSTNYEVDVDKICRLNPQNDYSLSYFDLANSAKLSNIALGITVSQIMSINIQQSSNSTIGNNENINFTILTSINSKPIAATLQCYIVANNYLGLLNNATTSDVGLGFITIQIPIGAIANCNLVVFARSSLDNRITSYAIYNIANSNQELTPNNDIFNLSPLNYTLTLSTNSSVLTVQGCYIFSYNYEDQSNTNIQNSSQFQFPKLIDTSPFVIIVYGLENGSYFQEWTSYPQIPLKTGSNFAGSEQNVFSYIVTINGVLCKLDISLGAVPP
jgi:hypothetical protein